MYNSYYQPTQMRQMMPILKGRQVASLDEVRAAQIDFDGSIFFFPDIANKKIYTKQIGFDGSPLLQVYELKNNPVELTTANPSYVTREEFEKVIEQIKGVIPKPVQQDADTKPAQDFQF